MENKVDKKIIKLLESCKIDFDKINKNRKNKWDWRFN